MNIIKSLVITALIAFTVSPVIAQPINLTAPLTLPTNMPTPARTSNVDMENASFGDHDSIDGGPVTITMVHIYKVSPLIAATCISFVNHSSKNISALRFHLQFKDSFGNQVGEDTVYRLGIFSPPVPIEGPRDGHSAYGMENCWQTYVAESFAQVIVTPLQAKYIDGTIWTLSNAT